MLLDPTYMRSLGPPHSETENRMKIARVCGGEKSWSYCLMGTVFLGDDEKVLGMDNSDGHV